MSLGPLLLLLTSLQPAQAIALPLQRIPRPAGVVPVRPPSTAPVPAPTLAADEQTLRSAGIDGSGPALLDFFRKRTQPPEQKHLFEAIKRLADRTPGVADRAAGDLVAWGQAAVPDLRRAANNFDDEQLSTRARQCLEGIEGSGGAALVQSAVRLLGQRKLAGTAEVLVAYLPFAEDDRTVEEIETALRAVAAPAGKPDSALLRAVTDPVPVRRTVAARMLCQAGGSAGQQAVRPLLADPRPSVRLQAALGLAGACSADAVPVLIDLVGELPADGRKQAEAYLNDLAGEWAIATPTGDDQTSRRLRRALWKAWWSNLEGSQLLAEFRSRTLGDDERETVLALIRKLDDVSGEVREKASADLVGRWGARAVPLLRQTVNREGPGSALAGRCLEAIEREGPRPLPQVAARLLALRRPEGTLETLLAYVPFAESDTDLSQVIDLLAVLGCPAGQAEASLLAALKDRVPARRAAAAVALCKGRAEATFPEVRRLLRDESPEVRLRAALALGACGERSAVPVLITLLGELPLQQAWEVEDQLVTLAGETAPTVTVDDKEEARKSCVEAWQGWWRERGAGADLSRLDPSGKERGVLLVIEQHNPQTNMGRVLEVGPDGKVRWQMDHLQFPWDAQACAGRHVLVVEQNMRVTERDRKGKVVWEKSVQNAFSAQRLSNGRTFIACRNQLLEVDREGKESFRHQCPTGNMMAARKFRDGTTAYVTYQGQYIKLDSAGKQIKTAQIPFNWQLGIAGGDLLSNGHVIVSMPNPGKVAEYDAEGKVVWETSVAFPGVPTQLSNGRTLVPSHSSTCLTELDRKGKIVSEKKDLAYRPFRVSRP
jgi:HEAT repeat protein